MTVLVNMVFHKVERNCFSLIVIRMKMIVVVGYNYFVLVALANIFENIF